MLDGTSLFSDASIKLGFVARQYYGREMLTNTSLKRMELVPKWLTVTLHLATFAFYILQTLKSQDQTPEWQNPKEGYIHTFSVQ